MPVVDCARFEYPVFIRCICLALPEVDSWRCELVLVEAFVVGANDLPCRTIVCPICSTAAFTARMRGREFFVKGDNDPILLKIACARGDEEI